MSGHAVRQGYMRQFKGLKKSSLTASTAIVAIYILQVLSAIALGYWLLQLPLTIVTGLSLGAIMFFIATRLRGFNNIVHECSHATFTENRAANVVFGSLCASLTLGSFRTYCHKHMSHHAHVGDYEHDLDLQDIRDFQLEQPLTPVTVLRHILTPILGVHLRHYLSVDLSAQDGVIFRNLKIALIAVAVVFLMIDPVAALVLVWIPYVWIFTAINYWTDCIDHGGLLEAGDDLDTSRNFLLAAPLKMLLFPRNDCYHLVHHLFPLIPASHLGVCHEQLMEHPDYLARINGPEAPGAQGSVVGIRQQKVVGSNHAGLRTLRTGEPS